MITKRLNDYEKSVVSDSCSFLDISEKYTYSMIACDFLTSGAAYPVTMVSKLWWKFMPCVTVCINWPASVDYNAVGRFNIFQQANIHYRPWLEQNIGKQGWDWDWGICRSNLLDRKITVRIRKKHAKFISMALLKWT